VDVEIYGEGSYSRKGKRELSPPTKFTVHKEKEIDGKLNKRPKKDKVMQRTENRYDNTALTTSSRDLLWGSLCTLLADLDGLTSR